VSEPIFGSDIIARFVAGILLEDPVVTATIGKRLANLQQFPASYTFPAAIHYLESGVYGGTTSGFVTSEDVRYVVRFACIGESNAPIKAAALRAAKLLNNAYGTVSYEGEVFQVAMRLFGEYPLTLLAEGDKMFRQLGNYFSAEVLGA
jgi:hypothetical protein